MGANTRTRLEPPRLFQDKSGTWWVDENQGTPLKAQNTLVDLWRYTTFAVGAMQEALGTLERVEGDLRPANPLMADWLVATIGEFKRIIAALPTVDLD